MNNPTHLDQLLPCPFCGGKAQLTYAGKGYKASCADDDCLMDNSWNWVNKESACKAWNTRPQPNDADVVEVMAAGIWNRQQDHCFGLGDYISNKTLRPQVWEDAGGGDLVLDAQAALKALSDNGYRIVKEG